MSVIDRLATSLGRRDDVPNQELARELAEARARADIRELVANLGNQDPNIQSDCIKVLYEIGYIAPELIAEYVENFLALLNSKNNRMVWGSMCALATIADLKADVLYQRWYEIRDAIEKGSVITVDRGIKTLSAVARKKEQYREDILPYLLEHLRNCRAKYVPQRAEAILRAVDRESKEGFVEVIQTRMVDMRPSQEKRLRRVLAATEKL
ncbi:MAG: hypothetical protein D6802_06530 [Ardenticatenia bacterium]|nr:MAG: hypothetical protein D6802_06530 [Ardenticatenia bacterium]